MNENERGPGYYDVEQYAKELRTTWGHAVRFEVTPPIYAAGVQLSGWMVRGEAWRNEGHRTIVAHAFSCSYGKNGGTKTMPAAMYGCLMGIWAKFEGEADAAAEQAAF